MSIFRELVRATRPARGPRQPRHFLENQNLCLATVLGGFILEVFRKV